MHDDHAGLFDRHVWRPALEKFGAVTHLTVTVFDAQQRAVCCEPATDSPLFALFQEYAVSPAVLFECARHCLTPRADRRPAVVAYGYGLAVVGTSLVLDNRIVGAAVAGYALVDFCQSTAIGALARQVGIPFRRLWTLAQQQQPVPSHRLVVHGELLQLLGDTILREHERTRQYEATAVRLEAEARVKDEFLAVLSHELRTPLTPLVGWARVLEKAGDNPETRIKAAQSIKRNALLQLKLVEDLLDLSRVTHGKIALDVAPLDLGRLLCSMVDAFAESAASKDVFLQFMPPDEPLTVDGDSGRLQQIFANVVSNALKFTPSHGAVRITATRQGDEAIVRVADTGEGIAPHFLPHVFDMFRQEEQGTRRRHSGLGIGLALVKRLVELHKGRVSIDSRGVGHGAEVTVWLPVGQPPANATDGIEQPSRSRPFEGRTILVVEDTEDALESTRMMLDGLGASVLAARNGHEALDVLLQHAADVVLCDLRMPEMDGFEFFQEYSRREGSGRAPVVAMTGLVTQADHDRTRAAGFAGHLEKPFDDVALIAAVDAALHPGGAASVNPATRAAGSASRT